MRMMSNDAVGMNVTIVIIDVVDPIKYFIPGSTNCCRSIYTFGSVFQIMIGDRRR